MCLPICFHQRSKLQLVKLQYIQLSGYISGNLDDSIMFFKISVYRIGGVQCFCYFAYLWWYLKSLGIMNTALVWCACTPRGISTNHARLICCGTGSVTGQDAGCKQHGQTATIWLKTLFMPRLVVCSRDLHWHWINWTLLCDTMEVSMHRLAWLPIAQHVSQPALIGRLDLISRKIVSCELDARSYHDFTINITLLGATSVKYAK